MSFVDSEEEARKEAEKLEKENKGKVFEKNPNPNDTIFSYLKKMIEVMEEQTKHFKSMATSLEKFAFDKKVEEVKTSLLMAKKQIEVSPSIKNEKTFTKVEEPKAPIKMVKSKPEKKSEIKKATGSAGIFQSKFPPELKKLLTFEDDGDYVKIIPKQFLTDAFPKVATIVRDLGGEYISCGKDSHFKVKKLP